MGGSSKPKSTVKPKATVQPKTSGIRMVDPARPVPMAAPAQPVPIMAAASAAPANNVFKQSSAALTDALAGTRAGMQYQPQQVQTNWGYDPANVTAQQAAGGINTYMNPYTQQVIDTSMADLERQRLMQQNQLGQQASAANAFGGSRQGIAEAMTNEAFARQGGQLAAGLQQQGFNTALSAAQQDASNQLQAGMANQGAFNAAQQFGQNLGFGAQTANQGAGLQGAQLRLGAANQLGGLSNTAFNFGNTITQQQMQQGAMQQANQQALIDAARNQYAGFTNSPNQALNTNLQAVGAANMGQNTTTQTYNPGLFGALQFGAGLLPRPS